MMLQFAFVFSSIPSFHVCAGSSHDTVKAPSHRSSQFGETCFCRLHTAEYVRSCLKTCLFLFTHVIVFPGLFHPYKNITWNLPRLMWNWIFSDLMMWPFLHVNWNLNMPEGKNYHMWTGHFHNSLVYFSHTSEYFHMWITHIHMWCKNIFLKTQLFTHVHVWLAIFTIELKL